MTDRPNTTRTDTTTRSTTTTPSTATNTRSTTTTRPPRPSRRYPNDIENMDAPLVPFIQQPGEEDEMTNIRRELAALRSQLNRIEQTMQTTTPTDTQ
ncbi:MULTISPECIES: hypothetical protein [Haloferax]|uniref:Uncharacterized protein n=1 Tax=Haloferax marinum TaxID=2666143 RepID=A0A6A8G832_9EURY|nr:MULTISPECIES: hypothetical protein [Haloferax]KAB1198109.1 hypothetical protein Hfx1150_11480 [Haloferax sp. CBA1150]MRW97181.1 hypothetical protein [Haloferax marinum]